MQNLSHEIYRRMSREMFALEEAEDLPAGPDDDDGGFRRDIEHCVGELGESHRVALNVLLRRCSLEDVARILNTTSDYAAKLSSQARRLLRECWRAWGGGGAFSLQRGGPWAMN